MKTNVYSVFDSKAGAYLQPFFAANDALALRAFSGALFDDNHPFARHAADYTLFGLGQFDDETGFLESYPGSTNLGNGLQLKSSLSISGASSVVEPVSVKEVK